MSRSALIRPVHVLADVLRAFVRSPVLRGLAIEADARLTAAALQTIAGFEFHADNRAPFLTLALDAQTDNEAAWATAVDLLRQEHARAKTSGAPLKGLEPRPLANQGAGDFSAQVLQCVHTVEAPAESMMLVVHAKGRVAPQWLARLGDMAGSKELAALRWIVVTAPGAELARWVGVFPKGVALHHRATVDENAAVAEIEHELDAEEERGVGMRGAGPKGVQPPPRPRRWRAPSKRRPPLAVVSRPPSVPPSAHQGHDDDAVAEPEPPAPPDVRLLIQRAALAMRRGDGPGAIGHQAAARDLCLEAGAVREAVSMELMLGAYLADLGQARLAAAAFGRAGSQALSIEANDLAAEAFTAQGTTEELDDDPVAALKAYRHAIESAQASDRPQLALQAYWLAGQTALRLDLDIDCIGLWADAVVYANKLDPELRAGSRAKAMAQELATLLARHRRYSQAREIARLAAGF